MQALTRREAASLEYNTLVENGTWEIVDLPHSEKAIGSGWVFRVKHNADGSIERFKAQIVAKGYSQRPGLDYIESFAPTFRPATLRIIMAMSAVEDLELRSVDITAAFINGETLDGAKDPFHLAIFPVFVPWYDILFDSHIFQCLDKLSSPAPSTRKREIFLPVFRSQLAFVT